MRFYLIVKHLTGDIFISSQVPLYAYGGRSFLSFSDVKKTSEGYDAQLGEV